MSNRNGRVHLLPGIRLSIRDGDVLLAVPTLHPQMTSADRSKVFELVLRRLYGEACDLAQDTADEIDRRAADLQRLAALMRATPHRNARGSVAA